MFSPILLFVQREGDNGVTRDEGRSWTISRVETLMESQSYSILDIEGNYAAITWLETNWLIQTTAYS